MVAATLDIYNTIADNLLPTPAKSHYTFNLRDLSKVFQVNETPAKTAAPLLRGGCAICVACAGQNGTARNFDGWFTFCRGLQPH